MNIRLNEDKEHVKFIRENLKKNNGYCPCSLIKSEDTKCMCKEFRDMSGTRPSAAFMSCITDRYWNSADNNVIDVEVYYTYQSKRRRNLYARF